LWSTRKAHRVQGGNKERQDGKHIFRADEWKHTTKPLLNRDLSVLNIILVKDPLFWIKSMMRNPYDIPFDLQDISQPFEYQGRQFDGLADLWNFYLEIYRSEFSSRNTLILRNHDALFRWKEAMKEIVRAWLGSPVALRPASTPGTPSARSSIYVDETMRTTKVSVAKALYHRLNGSRNLDEARVYYGKRANRLIGWSKAEMRYLRKTLKSSLLEFYGYGWEGTPGNRISPLEVSNSRSMEEREARRSNAKLMGKR
jgi:hypothetical protein